MLQIKYVVTSHTEEERRASSDLMTECFGSAIGMAYEKLYSWQFLENPAGNASILMAYDGRKPIGQIVSIPCRYKFMDRNIPTSITGEWLCVSPKYRGKGIASELIERRIKTTEHQLPFVLDLPNDAAMKVFLNAGYYQTSMKLLVRPLKLSKCFVYKQIPRIVLKPFDVIWRKKVMKDNDTYNLEEYSLPLFDNRFDELFKAASTKTLVRQIRDSEFLNWRYTNAPGRDYKTIIATGKDGTLSGYIIIRITVAYGIKVGFIMDLATREKDSKAGRNLIRFALEYFWNNDTAVAAALCFPNCMEYLSLRSEGFFICPKRIRPNPFILCIKTLQDDQHQYDMNVLKDSNQWFFMFGDFQVH